MLYRSRKSAKLAVLATTPEEVLDCPLCSCRLERKAHPLLLPYPLPSTLSLSLHTVWTHAPLPLVSTSLETSCSLDLMNNHGFTYTCTLWIHRGRETLDILLTRKDLFCIRDKGWWLCFFWLLMKNHIGKWGAWLHCVFLIVWKQKTQLTLRE